MVAHSASEGVAGVQSRIIEKCNYFVNVQLWPLRDTLDVDGWLANFRDDEVEHVTHLLDFFMYYSERMIDALLLSSFQNLSQTLRSIPPNGGVHNQWRVFFDTVLITYVTGEQPNVTDSGLTFARKARQILDIPEERIVSPERAVAELLRVPRPIVLLDDFVGSGSQCISTWHRQYPAFAGATRSLADIAKVARTNLYYCPVLCTSMGLRNIRRSCPGLSVRPAHVIDRRYNVLSSTSSAWPATLRPNAREILKRASKRAGIPDTNGRAVDDWQGFRRLGLALAFHNSVPDATLPLFYWERNGWTPLVKRK
jgi:hypothetical protein